MAVFYLKMLSERKNTMNKQIKNKGTKKKEITQTKEKRTITKGQKTRDDNKKTKSWKKEKKNRRGGAREREKKKNTTRTHDENKTAQGRPPHPNPVIWTRTPLRLHTRRLPQGRRRSGNPLPPLLLLVLGLARCWSWGSSPEAPADAWRRREVNGYVSIVSDEV